jgi:hypothetical protein
MLKSRIKKLERVLKLNSAEDTDDRDVIIIDSIYKLTKFSPFIEGKRKGEKKIVWSKSMKNFIKDWFNNDEEI